MPGITNGLRYSPALGRQRRWRQQTQPNHNRHTRPMTTATRIFMCGLLAGVAGAACASGESPVPQAASTVAPAVPSISQAAPVTSQTSPVSLPSAFVSSSAVCDVTPLDKPDLADYRSDDGYMATAKFVAYGDVDNDDDVPCGMLPDVRIAVMSEEFFGEEVLQDWWEAVGGNELGIEEYIPPGVRVPSTAEKLSNAPAQFIATSSDGTVEVPVAYEPEPYDYMFCAIWPSDDWIAGCNYLTSAVLGIHTTVYIYLTHGHAIVDLDSSDRYQRFLNIPRSAEEPATVTFAATLGDDTGPSRPSADVDIVVVGDAHVNAWWAVVSDNGANPLELDRISIGSEVLEHDWIHVITTGLDGLAETALPQGDYLICAEPFGSHRGCLYENLASGHHEFHVDYWDGGNDFSLIKR